MMDSFFSKKYKPKFVYWLLDSDGKSKELYLSIMEVLIQEANTFIKDLKQFCTQNEVISDSYIDRIMSDVYGQNKIYFGKERSLL